MLVGLDSPQGLSGPDFDFVEPTRDGDGIRSLSSFLLDVLWRRYATARISRMTALRLLDTISLSVLRSCMYLHDIFPDEEA